MLLRVKYHLFTYYKDRWIPDGVDYTIIEVDSDIDPNSREGMDEITNEVSRIIGRPSTDIKVLSCALI